MLLKAAKEITTKVVAYGGIVNWRAIAAIARGLA